MNDILNQAEYKQLLANLNYKLTAREVCERIPVMSEEDLTDYAEAGYAPCVLHTKTGALYFSLAEIKEWLARHFTLRRGGMPPANYFTVSYLSDKQLPEHVPEPLMGISELRTYSAGVFPPCIYFLTLKQVVVYVGQTIQLPARVISHLGDKSKNFDSVFYIPVPRHRLTEVELAFINALMPPLNYNGRSFRALSDSEYQVLREYGLARNGNRYDLSHRSR